MQGPVLFKLMAARGQWLQTRQTLLAQNIANANTPGYRPKDLDEAAFGGFVAKATGSSSPGTLLATDPNHVQAALSRMSLDLREASKDQSTVSGNGVQLEEEAQAMAHVRLDHELTSSLYRKYLNLFRTALGQGTA